MAVATLSRKKRLTAEDLYGMPDHGGRNELVRGELVSMSPASTNHGRIVFRIGLRIGNFVEKHDLGEVYAAETGFTLQSKPDTVRAPDVAFVARERIPVEGVPERGFWEIAPDLIVEVLSPNDKASEVQDKVRDYLTAGVGLVWLVDPQTETVTVYHSLDRAHILLADDTLDGGEVLPGFRLPVAEMFV